MAKKEHDAILFRYRDIAALDVKQQRSDKSGMTFPSSRVTCRANLVTSARQGNSDQLLFVVDCMDNSQGRAEVAPLHEDACF